MDVVECACREAIKLAPFASRIELAGSIRRQKSDPNDADIVLIPKDPQCKRRIMAYAKLHKTGKIGHGANHLSYIADSVEVELYFATEENFGAMCMYATGSSRYNIWMRKLAKFRKMKLSQYGLFKRDSNKRIAGETEVGIYQALGKKWREPWKRGLFETRGK